MLKIRSNGSSSLNSDARPCMSLISEGLTLRAYSMKLAL